MRPAQWQLCGVVSLCVSMAGHSAAFEGMNGEYAFANQLPGTKAVHRGSAYFDVYSPVIWTHYSEVAWKPHSVPLDPALVKKLDGKLINFVGYEFDIVRVDNATGKESSVPAWEHYNHHYGNSIVGKAAAFVKTGVPTDLRLLHEDSGDMSDVYPGYEIVAAGGGPRKAPPQFATQALIMGNGAESRKTFHYFPPGYGAQVHSPTTAALHAMIIDTKNREGPTTRHGKQSTRSNVGPEEMYNGLMECPCTDKYAKLTSEYSTLQSGVCGKARMSGAAQCFGSAGELGLSPVLRNTTTHDAELPAGCTVTALSGGYELTFNANAASSAACGVKRGHPAVIGLAETAPGVTVSVKLDPRAAPPMTVLDGEWYCANTGKAPYSIRFFRANGTLLLSMSGRAGSPPEAPKPALQDGHALNAFKQGHTKASKGVPVVGTISADFNSISFTNNRLWTRKSTGGGLAILTLSGPADVWFGFGFGATSGGSDNGAGGGAEGITMSGTPYTVVVLGNGTVQERKLGVHEEGSLLPRSVNVSSSSVKDGVRTVVLHREFDGVPGNAFSFDHMANSMDYIAAKGATSYLSHHRLKSSGSMYFVELGAPTCICDTAAGQGSIGGYAWGAQRCVDSLPYDGANYSVGQMLADPGWGGAPNPTCFLKSYMGGLRCCKDGSILLDANQSVPAELDHYQLKYRYYYEEGSTQNVTDTFRTSWWTEHNNNEHDIPQCKPGTKPEDCVYTISSNFTAGMLRGCEGGCKMIHMEGHCHVGCQKMEMWIVDDEEKPELLCRTHVQYGTSDAVHDEMGYILGNLPCIFGRPEDGFAPPVSLKPSTKLRSFKMQNSTNARWGDMGLWELRAAP